MYIVLGVNTYQLIYTNTSGLNRKELEERES